MKIEIALPKFYGFYESPLDDYEISDDIESYGDVTQDQYEKIDWKATHKAISIAYLDKYWEQNKETLNAFGISSLEFKGIDSPKYYNYSTDVLACYATLDKTKFRKEIKKLTRENWQAFEIYIKEKYSSRSGFVSFYSNDADKWIDNLLVNDLETDNNVLEGFLEFIMNMECEYTENDLNDYISETKHEYLNFINE